MYLNCLLNPATPSLAVLQAGLKKNEEKKEEERKEDKTSKGALKLVFNSVLFILSNARTFSETQQCLP